VLRDGIQRGYRLTNPQMIFSDRLCEACGREYLQEEYEQSKANTESQDR
jgi:hypothetical protein